MRRDFRAPEARDLPYAGHTSTPRQRARSVPADARPTVAAGAATSQPSRGQRAFMGESSSHRDFAPPPHDAYRRSQPPRSVQSQQAHHEGRDFATTSRVAFGSPALAIKKVMSSDSACPASRVCAVQPPPKPPNGREHVYYDQAARVWF